MLKRKGITNVDETIKLDQFLKLAQVVQSGGEAKRLIQSGFVRVNGDVETRRGRKLHHGDVVMVDDEELIVLVEVDEDKSGEDAENNP